MQEIFEAAVEDFCLLDGGSRIRSSQVISLYYSFKKIYFIVVKQTCVHVKQESPGF